MLDQYRFDLTRPNTALLQDCINIINETKYAKIGKSLVGYEASLKSLALTSGFTSEKENQCLNLIKTNVLKEGNIQDNRMLIYFENFFNVYFDEQTSKKKDDIFKEFRELLYNKNLVKLIVRWEDRSLGKRATTEEGKAKAEREKIFFEKLSKEKQEDDYSLYFINFRPYTRGKFHHKAIIQYPKDRKEEPTLYTGSFNFSNSAVLHNSENIIGIKDKELVEDYFCSILWNSNLVDNPKIWRFFQNQGVRVTFLPGANSNLNILARNTLLRCRNHLKRYVVQLDSFKERLIASGLKKKDVAKINEFITKFKEEKDGEKSNIIHSRREDLFKFEKEIKAPGEGSLGFPIRKKIATYIKDIFSILTKRKLMSENLQEDEKDTNAKEIKKIISTIIFNDQYIEESYEEWIGKIAKLVNKNTKEAIIDLITNDKKNDNHPKLETLTDYLKEMNELEGREHRLKLKVSDLIKTSSKDQIRGLLSNFNIIHGINQEAIHKRAISEISELLESDRNLDEGDKKLKEEISKYVVIKKEYSKTSKAYWAIEDEQRHKKTTSSITTSSNAKGKATLQETIGPAKKEVKALCISIEELYHTLNDFFLLPSSFKQYTELEEELERILGESADTNKRKRLESSDSSSSQGNKQAKKKKKTDKKGKERESSED